MQLSRVFIVQQYRISSLRSIRRNLIWVGYIREQRYYTTYKYCLEKKDEKNEKTKREKKKQKKTGFLSRDFKYLQPENKCRLKLSACYLVDEVWIEILRVLIQTIRALHRYSTQAPLLKMVDRNTRL